MDCLQKLLSESPGDLLVRIPGCLCGGLGSVAGWGTEGDLAKRRKEIIDCAIKRTLADSYSVPFLKIHADVLALRTSECHCDGTQNL